MGDSLFFDTFVLFTSCRFSSLPAASSPRHPASPHHHHHHRARPPVERPGRRRRPSCGPRRPWCTRGGRPLSSSTRHHRRHRRRHRQTAPPHHPHPHPRHPAPAAPPARIGGRTRRRRRCRRGGPARPPRPGRPGAQSRGGRPTRGRARGGPREEGEGRRQAAAVPALPVVPVVPRALVSESGGRPRPRRRPPPLPPRSRAPPASGAGQTRRWRAGAAAPVAWAGPAGPGRRRGGGRAAGWEGALPQAAGAAPGPAAPRHRRPPAQRGWRPRWRPQPRPGPPPPRRARA